MPALSYRQGLSRVVQGTSQPSESYGQGLEENLEVFRGCLLWRQWVDNGPLLAYRVISPDEKRGKCDHQDLEGLVNQESIFLPINSAANGILKQPPLPNPYGSASPTFSATNHQGCHYKSRRETQL